MTGAGSGIGRACTHALVKRGLHVIAVGRRRRALEETVAELERGGSAEAVSADVSSDEGIAKICAAAQRHTLAGIVHAAGRESLVPFAETDRAELEAVFATNLYAPVLLTRAVRDRLDDGAAIVLVSSIAAFRGRDRHAAYASSKAALLGLTRNLAVELAPRVRVNAVVPGPVQTPMLEQYLSEYVGTNPSDEVLATIRLEAQRVPLGRIAEASEVAATIVHLLLDATAVTGAAVPIDLGYTAR